MLLAAAGVLPFLTGELRWEQLGMGMMSAGLGMTILASGASLFRTPAAGRSDASMLGVLVAAPRWVAVSVIGGGLLLLGLFLLFVAVAGG